MTDAISLRLRGAQAWVRHDDYSRPEPPGYVRDSAPFEAADMLELQQREIASLKAALKAEQRNAALVRAQALEEAAKIVDAAQPMGKIAATAAAIRALKGATGAGDSHE
jgi:hypothetical protein